MRTVLALVLLLTLLAPVGAAQAPPTSADAWVTLSPEGAVENDPRDVLALNRTESLRWVFDLDLEKPYTVIEIQGRGLGLERARQLVPSLVVPETRYPLFYPYPNERVWEADAPTQVFHVTGSGDDLVLRVGVPGPARETLVLEVDTVPPAYEVGPAQNITAIGFYVETQTTEFALGDLQVREVGASEWIRNPTPEYHVLQKFPIQGLDADTEHEAQVVFEDWAGNVATSPAFTLRTAPPPQFDPVIIRPLEPVPNSTVEGEEVLVRAVAQSSVPLAREHVRLFFDLREMTDFEVHGADITYRAGALPPGSHRVGIEVTNAEGGAGRALWSFTVAGKGAPLPAAAWVVLALAATAACARPLRRG